MSLAAFSVRRPVTAAVLNLLLILFGLAGLMRLSVRELPAVDRPVVSVDTDYPGAAPEVVATQITEPLEQILTGLAGLETMRSTSEAGESSIRLEFGLDTDLDVAVTEVSDKVRGAIRRLPPDAEPPVVRRRDANATPIIFLSAQSSRRDALDLNDYVRDVVKERMGSIDGVADIWIFGERKRAMRLWLDPIRMANLGITPQDVQDALARENVDLPAGQVEGPTYRWGVRASGNLETPEAFNQLLIRVVNGRPIRLADIGHAEMGAENDETIAMRDNMPYAALAVTPQPNANAVAIADEFMKRLDQLQASAPADLELEVAYDWTIYIRRAIREVWVTLAIAFLLVVVVILAFLRSWRAALLPVVAIPVSLASTFMVMHQLGYSLNVLTLVALVLAIGLVVDDAIVVLENIYAHRSRGIPPKKAAVRGTRQVFTAVIATTAVLVAVFLPILFLEGQAGRLFREFGIVLSAAVIASSFVALTLIPMLAVRLYRGEVVAEGDTSAADRAFLGPQRVYDRLLGWALRRRWLAWLAFAASVGAVVLVYPQLPRELAPYEDRSNIRASFKGPEGATLNYTIPYLKQVGQYVMDSIPEVQANLTYSAEWTGGPNTGLLVLYLTNPEDRERTQDDIAKQLTAYVKTLDGVNAGVNQPPTIGSRFGGPPVEFVLTAPDLPTLNAQLEPFLKVLEDHPALQNVNADYRRTLPQLRVSLNRQRAADLGVSIREVARALQLSLSETRYGWFVQGAKQYAVIGQLDETGRDSPTDIPNLHVRSQTGALVPLEQLVTVEEVVVAGELQRYNRFYATEISANIEGEVTLGRALDVVDSLRFAHLPPARGWDHAWRGQSASLREGGSNLDTAFLLALLVVYLVLAAQFESWMAPVVILITVPLAVLGGLLALWISGESLNLFSQIGLVMLVGLVTKNGILVVEFANQRRRKGVDALKAARQAAVHRLRPVLMTTVSTALGVLPLAVASGAASASRQSMGIAVLGGVLLSAGLSLFLVPAIYATLMRWVRR